MLEYILFDDKLFQLFTEWLKDRNIACETEVDEDNYVIKVSEDIDDDLLDEIDEKYEALMELNQELINDQEKENNDGYNMAGVVVTLKDGTISYADIDSKLMARVISVISPEEFGEIITAIANAVENPQPKTFCQRMREK